MEAGTGWTLNYLCSSIIHSTYFASYQDEHLNEKEKENSLWDAQSELKQKTREYFFFNVKLPHYKHRPHMNLEDSYCIENKTLVINSSHLKIAECIINLNF